MTTTRYEVVRCSNVVCRREFVRPAEGYITPPCSSCHCETYATALVDAEPTVGAVIPHVTSSFSLSDVRSTLEWVISREQARSEPVGAASSWHAGRASAFSEALEMIEAIARHDAAAAASVSDPLRTEEIA